MLINTGAGLFSNSKKSAGKWEAQCEKLFGFHQQAAAKSPAQSPRPSEPISGCGTIMGALLAG
ncbi:MAG TPA: hypothetical protein VGB81_15910 [Devosia sp.]